MSEENKVGLQTDPNDISNIERLIKSVDKLDSSLQHLAQAGKGMTELGRMMANMQATMVTGFTEMAALAAKSGEKMVADRQKSAERMVAEEEKAWEKMFFTSQKALARAEAALEASNAKRIAAGAAAAEKLLLSDVSAENKRAAALQALIERRDVWEAESRAKKAAAVAASADRVLAIEIAAENKRASSLQAAMQRQDLWEAEERGRQYAAAAAHQSKLEALAASSAEKQRVLNSGFVTSPIKSQISTAEQAAVYGSMGGNAAQRFGSAAAGADLAALRAQYAAMPAATRASADGILAHNQIMQEGHALARGLSGSLGALWLTYGSLVPLAAGAAIGASLKNIVTVGKEIEYQFKFVEALGNAPVKIDDFLRVTDGTVVSVKEAAEGMRALSQNGLDAVQSLQVLPTILNLSVIGEMSVGAAALAATGAVSAFGLQLGDVARVGDVFAQAAASSNTSVALMAESMKQASTVASIYHVSLEETAGALGQLAKINITGSAAGTSFTNMMTGLYAPTNQAQKALAQLKITTDDGQGGLKNSTQLLGELRVALSQYNESAQSVYLNDIFTTRGAKAASQLLENYGELKGRIEDAANSTGFMSAAVAKLEDSTQGAFLRMKNSITSTFFEAFTSSSPALQQLITDLGHLAGSKGAVDVLTGMADAALRLVDVVRNNSTAILTMAGALASIKLYGMLAPMFVGIAEAMAVTSVATVTLGGAVRGLMASLGPIGLAIAAATLAWTLFIDKTTDVEKSNLRLQNSINTNIDFLERETRALQERNKAWNPETQKFDLKPESQTSGAALANYQKAQDELTNFRPSKGLGDNAWVLDREKAVARLAEAKRDLWKETAAQESLAEGLSEESARKDKANVLTQIESLYKKGETATTVNGKIIALDALGNEKSRAVALQAKDLEEKVLKNKLSTKQAQIEVIALEQQYNATLQAKPPKDDKKAAADALRAELERLKLNKELLAVEQQTQTLRDQAANKAGTLGDLGLLDAENKMAKAKAQASIDAAKASIDEVTGIENKRAATARYKNALDVANATMAQQDIRTGIAKEALFEKMSQDATRYAAKTLSDQGQYVNAFLMEYAAEYGPTIKRVEADLTTDISEENRKRLESYLDYLAKMKAAGESDAKGKALSQGFNAEVRQLQVQLADLADMASGQSGLGTIFASAEASAAEYEQRIGSIAKKQAELQSLADQNPGNPKLQEQATAELDKMHGLAEQMRAMWVTVGEQIGTSLTGAFGRGGTALGGLLQATIAYGNQKAKIEETKNKGDAGDFVAQIKANQVAAQASTSAQIAYYGKLAGAAQAYFKEGSLGYKVMGNVEKATQIAGLAEAARMFIVKSGYLTGLLGIQVASQAEAAAAEGAYTLSSIAMAGARAAASGIAAAVSAMVGWPFPLNMVALAATVAAVGALGVKIAGGGGGSSSMSAESRQASNGTGTNPDGTLNGGGILGDTSAKSESIAKSLEAIDKNSGLQLAHTISMDGSLKTLVSNISGLASLLVRGTDLDAPVPKATNGMAQNLVNNSAFQLAFGGPLGLTLNKLDQALGGIGGKITGAIFGGKKTVEDVGLKLNSGSLAALMAQGGVDVKQYTDIKKKGGLFSSDKYSTDTTSLGSEVNDQFSKIFKSLYDTVVAGANILGLGGDAFSQKLKGFVVDIGEISTKGMKGTEIETALQTAFSKLGDDMAKFGVDGLQQFQKVGEGYLETLTRVANDFLQVNDVLSVLGKSFNVTGMAAVVLSENLISAAGGLETLTKNTSFFVENFLSESEKMAPIIKSVDSAFAGLHLAVPATADAFKQLVLAQDLNTDAGQQMYTALLAIAPAFKTISDYAAEMSGVIVKSAQAIRDERKTLQDQYDKLTMTPDQLAAKERAGVDPSNLALYDTVTKLDTAAKQLTATLDLQAQIYEITGNKVGAAAVLEQQHQIALKGMTAETAKWTKELWAAQAAQTATKDALAAVTTAMTTVSTIIAAQKDSINKAYQTQSDALAASITKSSDAVTKLQSLADALHSTLDSMSVPGQEKADRASAQAQLQAALAIARAGGPLPDADSLKGALGTVSKDASSQFSTSLDYNRDLYRTKNTVGDLTAYTDKQLTTEQRTLKVLQAQKEALDLAHTQDLARLDGILSAAQAQVNLLTGVTTSTASLALAMSQLAASLSTASKDPGVGTDALTGLYKDLLGRAPDAEGLKFWQNALKSGATLDSIKQDFIRGSEYQGLHPGATPGFANGGDHAGGLRMVGERGVEIEATGSSRIWNADQMSKAVGGGNSEVARAVNQLTRQMEQVQLAVEKLQKPAEDTAEATVRTAKIMKNITPEGDKVQTKEKA